MGLFPATSWSRKSIATVPNCGPCGLVYTSKYPKVPVKGRGRAGILLVGEHPGGGAPNKMIEAAVARTGLDPHEDCWLTWATVCAPPDGPPTDEQLTHCRPALQKVIEELNPSTIIPFGGYAVKSLLTPIWRDDQGYSIQRWVGWRIPCQRPNAWICPVSHPAFTNDNNAELVMLFLDRHLRAATGLVGRPWATPPDYAKQVRVVMTDAEAVSLMRVMRDNYPSDEKIAVDIETNMLKPDSDAAFIFTCALSNGDLTISYPWTRATAEATRELIHSGRPFVASNMKFEERWFLREFGRGVDYWYRDTMLRAHWEDCRGGKGDGGGGGKEKHEAGITGLKFQSFIKLGQPNYNDTVAPYLESSGGANTPNRIKQSPLHDLLLYGGMDAILERKLVP